MYSVSLLHPGNSRFTGIYCGYTIHTSLIGSFCFTACMLHSSCATLHILLAKKIFARNARDSGSSYCIKFSIPESKLCCYEIMTQHSYPLRLYSQCQLLQQKEDRAVFYVDDDFLPPVLCKPVSGMGAFLSCHSSVTLL